MFDNRQPLAIFSRPQSLLVVTAMNACFMVAAVIYILAGTCFAGDVDATQFPGSDPCARVNAALATLPAYGGVIDATGFNQTQLGNPCHTTITVSVPATIKFGPASWTIAANPGINIKSPRVTITCQHGGEADIYGIYPATFYSGGTYPLIADTVASPHGTDEFAIHNCPLDGNGMGTFGLFFPYGFSGLIDQSTTRSFTAAGQFILDGHWTAFGNSSASNGGDGVVWSYDGVVDGYPQYVLNQGVGIHNISGGTNFHSVTAYHNRLHGIYLDGRWIQDWGSVVTYVVPSFINPQSGNAGHFVYYTQKVGTTSGARPSFCQTVGCTLSDGSVTWINAGTAYGYGLAPLFNTGFYWASIETPTCVDNGYDEPLDFVSDNIRMEGNSIFPVRFTSITAPNCVQSRTEDFAANGIHLLNTDYIPISNYTWLGSGYVNVPGGAGLLVENSSDVALSGMASQFAYANTIKLINSKNSIFTSVIAVDTAVASTPVEGTYGLYIDSQSSNNIFGSLWIRDDRTPPYSRGIFNIGQGNLISNYMQSNLRALTPTTGQDGYNQVQVLPSIRGPQNSGSTYQTSNQSTQAGFGAVGGGTFVMLQSTDATSTTDCSNKDKPTDTDPSGDSDGSKSPSQCPDPTDAPDSK